MFYWCCRFVLASPIFAFLRSCCKGTLAVVRHRNLSPVSDATQAFGYVCLLRLFRDLLPHRPKHLLQNLAALPDQMAASHWRSIAPRIFDVPRVNYRRLHRLTTQANGSATSVSMRLTWQNATLFLTSRCSRARTRAKYTASSGS